MGFPYSLCSQCSHWDFDYWRHLNCSKRRSPHKSTATVSTATPLRLGDGIADAPHDQVQAEIAVFPELCQNLQGLLPPLAPPQPPSAFELDVAVAAQRTQSANDVEVAAKTERMAWHTKSTKQEVLA